MRTRHAVVTAVALAILIVAMASRRPGAAAGAAPPAARLLSPSDLATASRLAPGDRGATYYWLEGLAQKVTVEFGDATAVTERGADGAIRTRLSDGAGNELATFQVSRVGSSTDALDYRPHGGTAVVAARPAGVHPTSAWAGRQVYQLWKDGQRRRGAALQWRDGLMRRAGAPAGALDDETERIRTEWPDGMTATVTRRFEVRPNVRTGARFRGHAIVSRFERRGARTGSIVWYPEEQVLVWKFPGMTTGYVTADRLKEVGGWSFTPDMAWATVQGFAFQHFYAQIQANGFVARNDSPTWLGRAAGFLMPTLSANEPGCDGLHWLDGTIFRMCCDVHDNCYAKYGCSWKSWWQWWSSWSCDTCNMGAAFCFLTVVDPPLYDGYI
jgi:hypothetical protein